MPEFHRIQTHLAPLSVAHAGAYGLADDVALLAGGQVINTDTIIQGIHYIGDEAPGLIAKKLLRCNLSDLAAKGAAPRYYTLNLTLTPAQDDAWLAAFAAGLAEDQAAFGLTLIGGDSTIAPDGRCVLSATMFGEMAEGIGLPRRSGAKVGDVICVSGTLGDAAMGLNILNAQLSTSDNDYLINRYQLPQPRISLGQALAPLMHASLDISDGLMQDVGHIAHESHVGIRLFASQLPLSPALAALLGARDISIQDIASGGDDYEICCSISKENLPAAQAIAASLNTPLTPIGEAVTGAGVQMIGENGKAITFEKLGFVHG